MGVALSKPQFQIEGRVDNPVLTKSSIIQNRQLTVMPTPTGPVFIIKDGSGAELAHCQLDFATCKALAIMLVQTVGGQIKSL